MRDESPHSTTSGAQHLQQPAYDRQPCQASILIASHVSPHMQNVLHLGIACTDNGPACNGMSCSDAKLSWKLCMLHDMRRLTSKARRP